MKNLKPILILSLVLLIGFIISCDSVKKAKSPFSPEIPDTNGNNYPNQATINYTGNSVTVMTHHWEFTLINITSQESAGPWQPNGYFVPVGFRIKNINDYRPLCSDDFKMTDRDENLYYSNTRQGIEEEYFPGLFYGIKFIKPGEELTGIVVFDIPDQYLDNGLVLRFNCPSTETIIDAYILVDLSQ